MVHGNAQFFVSVISFIFGHNISICQQIHPSTILNKFNNVWTMLKNDGEMGKQLLTATVQVWRVWQGRQMLPFVAATTCKLLLEIYV
jgi:hypothetical protein